MNTIKSIFVAVMLFFGFSVVSANQASEVKKLHCLIADISEDVEDFAVKPIDAENVYNKFVVPLMEDKEFVNKLYKYRRNGAQYLGQSFATFAEIDYLVSIREYFINNKPKYDNENIDKGLYEIEKIILTKTADARFPKDASENYNDVYNAIVNLLKRNNVQNIEDYAEVLMVYFSDLDNVKVNIDNFFNSKDINEVLTYVSTHIIENGKAKDLEYYTGEVNVYDFLKDIGLKCAIIQSV